MLASPSRRTVRWRPFEGAGSEHCQIVRNDIDTRIRSAVITPDAAAFYRLKLDAAGNLRTVRIDHTDGRTFELFSDGAGNWSDDRAEPVPALRGCMDIDISATPLTNSLPIWRCSWTFGQPQRFSMAWIDLEAMTVERDDQIYTRLDATHFRYQAADGGFEADLTIDDDGLVLDYPGLFVRCR